MKRLIVVVLVVVALPALAADAPKPFTSKQGKFTVLFPSKPTEQKQEVETPIGKIAVTSLTLELKDRAYFTAYSDYPANLVKNQGIEPTLDGSRNGAVQNVKGKLLKEQKITLGKQKLPGREILIEAAGGAAHVRARIYIAGDRLYQVLVGGPEKFVASKEATAFLDSFKVND